MTAIHLRPSGAVLSCLLLLLTACADKPLVRTETVTVERPVVVALDRRLTSPVAEPLLPAKATNDALAGFAESAKCRLIAANCQLEKIEGSQPGDPRWPVKWCERYVEVCGGGE